MPKSHTDAGERTNRPRSVAMIGADLDGEPAVSAWVQRWYHDARRWRGTALDGRTMAAFVGNGAVWMRFSMVLMLALAAGIAIANAEDRVDRKRPGQEANAMAVAGPGLQATAKAAASSEFQIVRVASVSGSGVDQLTARTIFFNDNRADDKSDEGAFIGFEEWSRTKPLQHQFLTLYPGFAEGTTTRVVDGVTTEVRDRLHLYITEARFMLQRPASSVDLKQYATLPFVESMDPAIKHTTIAPSEVIIVKDERLSANRNPQRPWCEGPGVTGCIRSHYKLEGRLPTGIALANRLRENNRKLSDTIVFETEMRLLKPEDINEASLRQLTGVETPVAGVLEQNMFYVNQVMRFGKLLAVFQPSPNDPESTVATVMIALAVSSNTLESQKKYQNVPVLRNLVPSQVLLGNSSFNTGNSISSGLPNYVRNRIKAIAAIMERG